MGPAAVLPLMNLLVVGPRTTQLLQARGRATEGSKEWTALHKKLFAYHGMSSICNLGALLAQLGYACLLASKIPSKIPCNIPQSVQEKEIESKSKCIALH